MCGIAGIFHYAAPERGADRELLARMTRALAHRGPDGEGFHVDGPVGLGHRRLAIVDLTPTGAQPMANEDGRCWVAYNGEFYDHRAFRRELEGRHRFRGPSDTETLLHLVEERGVEGLARASAIFGLAFWDGRTRTLSLARDPAGVKQLYYHDDGRRVLFASEVKALLEAADVERDLDPEAMNEYLHFHTPLFHRTFFRGVRQVQPGEVVEWRAGGARRAARFYHLSRFDPLPGSPAQIVEELRHLLSDAVSRQLMSDVPVGAFFSGGIDSSAVASFAARAGKPPRLYGVHFAGQGVVDERPFQEAAAKALGLELSLLTLDGSSFADDLPRLIRQQDQPVIGAALLPMHAVSRLAAREVKVCLGGQAADELFGGYARYALAHPFRIAASILDPRRSRAGAGEPAVAGNLRKQAFDLTNLRRSVLSAVGGLDWRSLYFRNFAKVPEAAWKGLFEAEEVVSRESCWKTFADVVARSPAPERAGKLMHWDMQTYLPGLFQQDDRMSMANGLESRVPIADPRLLEFAVRVPFSLKFRAGASKWVLRRAVADVLPEEVLNRRKVGFDTPIEHWMKGPHAAFVRETLLSGRARSRGLWRSAELEAWLDHPARYQWVDVVWKALCIELWARELLDGGRVPAPARVPELRGTPGPRPAEEPRREARPAHFLREVRELGARGLAFRVGWETKLRTGLVQLREAPPPPPAAAWPGATALAAALPFDRAAALAARPRIPEEALRALGAQADAALRGRILAFGRWTADYGAEPDWFLNPVNGRRWTPDLHWSRTYGEEQRVGDIKLTWEIGRFPQAYWLARAAAFDPGSAARYGEGLARQVESFEAANSRYARGPHWASGQEIAFRLMSYAFALSAFGPASPFAAAAPIIARALHDGAHHIEHHLDYTVKAVFNNHLLSEAFALLLAGTLLPGCGPAGRWRDLGLGLLEEQVDRQIYADGAYIQQSHNYERVALLVYLWAVALRQRSGAEVPARWRAGLARAVDFLHAQQSPRDGRLPNYGSNDGALPSILSTCDFSDFRPALQAAHLAARGERLYPPGPWDECAAWFLGAGALDAPLAPRPRRSVSFAPTGFHVLRGEGEDTFAALRCGTIRDRFSQIDMLALDVWWRGENVLVDGGSYLYNGPQRWHEHFLRTRSHNTVAVDGRDQMLHYRRFKTLFWTEARLLRFDAEAAFTVAEGEHYGYRRHPGACTHRRAVLHAKDDLWVVVDTVQGAGSHAARLQWLGGDYPFRAAPGAARLDLDTPAGTFRVEVLDEAGRPLPGDVVAGRSGPPRGWLSRYYGEKVPVPSLAAGREGPAPLTFVTLLGPGPFAATVRGADWTVAAGDLTVAFRLEEGRLQGIRVERAARGVVA